MTWGSARKLPIVSLANDVIPIGQPQGVYDGHVARDASRNAINFFIFSYLRGINPAWPTSTLQDQ